MEFACAASAAVTLRPASLTAATMRSSSMVISPDAAEAAAGAMAIFSNSFLPFIRAVTAPPPELASKVCAVRLSSICCFICCACWSIAPSCDMSIVFVLVLRVGLCDQLRASSYALVLVAKINDVADLRRKKLFGLLHDWMLLDQFVDASCGCGALWFGGHHRARYSGQKVEAQPDVVLCEHGLDDVQCVGVDQQRQHRWRNGGLNRQRIAVCRECCVGQFVGRGLLAFGRGECVDDSILQRFKVKRRCRFGRRHQSRTVGSRARHGRFGEGQSTNCRSRRVGNFRLWRAGLRFWRCSCSWRCGL